MEILKILFAIVNPADPVNALLLVIIAGLIAVLIWVLRDRKRILAALKAKDEKLEEIIKHYYKGQTATSEAMHSLREVLIELKTLVGMK